MTTKTISTYIAAGYNLAAKYSELLITSTGGVGGFGVDALSFATISNYGKINASGSNDGVYLVAGGVVINQEGGFIGAEVHMGAQGTVTNHGRITVSGPLAIDLSSGGSIFNGSYADPGALISGGSVDIAGAAGTVSNLGTILGSVNLDHGGTLTNGGVNDTAALINGASGAGVSFAPGTVSNFGTIQAYAYQGVLLRVAGGSVTNGAVTDTIARVRGVTGVELDGAGIVTNFAVIRGTGAGHGAYGVALDNGGSVTNGTATHPSAFIEGYTGVSVLNAAGTVVNLGTIQGDGVGLGEWGAYLQAGGNVTNGAAGDTGALIEGAGGVALAAAGTITNFGVIDGATGYGAQLAAGGVLVNGALNNSVALIEGYTGLGVGGPATVTNFGTISGTGEAASAGAAIRGGVILINGAAGHANALIESFEGVGAYKTGNTVTNFGTILGAGGTAVSFSSSTDVLIVEAGSTFVGAVLGGGGTLDLDTGTGTLTGLLAGGNVTVSGSMAATSFSDFATVKIGAGATFASSGAVTIAAGQAVVDRGSLTLGAAKTTVTNAGLIEADGTGVLTIKGAVKNTGTLATNGGSLTVGGAVTGAGSATINGGRLDLVSGFNENVKFTGTTGILELAQSQSYAGTIFAFSKTGGTSLDLDDIAFGKATTASYSGTKMGGTLTVTDGTHTAHIALKGDYRTSTFIAASNGHGGTLVHDPSAPAPVSTSADRFAAAMAGLGGDGAGPVEARAPWAHAPPMLLAPRTQIA